jgi:hypothetical protein
MKTKTQKKSSRPCRAMPKITSTAAAIPGPMPSAGCNFRNLEIPGDFIAGAARGLAQSFTSADDLIAQQLAGFPILELARRVAAGKELEQRLQGLEARIRILEKAGAGK